jgi:parallel beta-helix repeat protein
MPRASATSLVLVAVFAGLAANACSSASSPVDPSDAGGETGLADAADLDARVDTGAPDGDASATLGCPALSPIAEPPERLYVAPGGSDSAAGSSAAPLKTLAEATKRFSAGGTVIVRGGTYPSQRLDAKGTAAHLLVIRAADGEVPIFDGADVTGDYGAVIQLWSAENVVLQGLEIRNCAASNCYGIGSPPVSNLTLRGCHIHDVQSAAAYFSGKTIRVEGNHIHDVSLTNAGGTATSGWPFCIGTSPDRDVHPSAPLADDVVFRDNRIENCWGEGIGVWFATNVLVEGNVVVNAYNVGIYLDNASNVTVSRNFVRMSRGLSGEGTGILMGTEPYPSWGLPSYATHDVAITNNVVVAGGGVGWWNSSSTSANNTYQGVRVLHNTVVATSGGALGFDRPDAGSPSACTAQNNVLSEAGGSDFGNAAAWSLASNAWLNAAKPPVAGATDVSVSAPLGPVATATDVQALATVVGTGAPGTNVPADFACKPRSATAPSRGAFER